MIVVGLAGQIASGKSEVARVFAAQGALMLSGDEIGKEVVESNPVVLRRLVKEFGRGIVTSTGRLRRKELARRAFADSEATDRLNRIVHPYLLRELRHRIGQHRKKQDVQILVVDAALILDWDLESELDFLIVVESRIENQLRRLARLGYSRAEALDRIHRQLPKYQQRRLADQVIHNDESKDCLRRKALCAYKKLLNLVDKH
jgi:dephospho-CoA kinase